MLTPRLRITRDGHVATTLTPRGAAVMVSVWVTEHTTDAVDGTTRPVYRVACYCREATYNARHNGARVCDHTRAVCEGGVCFADVVAARHAARLRTERPVITPPAARLAAIRLYGPESAADLNRVEVADAVAAHAPCAYCGADAAYDPRDGGTIACPACTDRAATRR